MKELKVKAAQYKVKEKRLRQLIEEGEYINLLLNLQD